MGLGWAHACGDLLVQGPGPRALTLCLWLIDMQAIDGLSMITCWPPRDRLHAPSRMSPQVPQPQPGGAGWSSWTPCFSSVATETALPSSWESRCLAFCPSLSQVGTQRWESRGAERWGTRETRSRKMKPSGRQARGQSWEHQRQDRLGRGGRRGVEGKGAWGEAEAWPGRPQRGERGGGECPRGGVR